MYFLLFMDNPLIYRILSGETIYAEWESLRATLEKTQTCSQELMLFIDTHRSPFWDKKFFDTALEYQQYELAAQLIIRNASNNTVPSFAPKTITSPGIFRDQAESDLRYKKEAIEYFFLKLQKIKELIQAECVDNQLEKIIYLINLLTANSSAVVVFRKPGF